MINYDMRISNRVNRDHEYLSKLKNAYKITRETINNLPCIQFSENKDINNLIRIRHILLMQKAMLRTDEHKYDEVGILMELVEPYDYRIFYGKVNPENGVSSINPDEDFMKYLSKHSTNQLIFMHNHPNNSGFSYGDLINFLSMNEIKAITAVGNSHGIHTMWKRNSR